MTSNKQTRRLVAALACRSGGTRLYGKPLQRLAPDTTVLDAILAAMKRQPQIDEIVLGVSEGSENLTFLDVAKARGVGFIVGSPKDVLWRLVQCGRAGAATDVFRITSECPFTAWEMLPDAWRTHVEGGYDITVTDWLPEGMNFEIYRLSALERSHAEGEDAERSEYCSAFARRRHDLFRIAVLEPPADWRRTDLRLTIDNPEDLILCRETYRGLAASGPAIPTKRILSWVDGRRDLHALVQPYIDEKPLWGEVTADRIAWEPRPPATPGPRP
jgi:spore coat polysaccharide biosynthesis protein SpsF